jgi:hypothetical protein
MHDHPLLREKLQGFRIDLVFDFEYTRGKSFAAVIVMHRHTSLHDDRSPVVFLVNQMDCGTGDFHTGSEYCIVHMTSVHAFAAKTREEGGMDIRHAMAKRCDNRRRYKLHVARKRYEVALRPLEDSKQFSRFPLSLESLDRQTRYIVASRELQCRRRSAIADNTAYPCKQSPL